MADPAQISFEQRLRMQRAAFGFPPLTRAMPHGLVARGGDLHPERLLVAYANGIFPWPHHFVCELLWFCPSPRQVIIPGSVHIGRSAARAIRKHRYQMTMNTAFADVIQSCATMQRGGVPGTWITPQMIAAYTKLHEAGFAHSVETWQDGELVGGIYGVSLGKAFFGESMFHTTPDASKIALIVLLKQLDEWGFRFLDCQTPSPITTSLGAVQWDMVQFQTALNEALSTPTRKNWVLRNCAD